MARAAPSGDAPPGDPGRASAFVNLRVADCRGLHRVAGEGRPVRGQAHGPCSRSPRIVPDPDGHLIEAGQAKASPNSPGNGRRAYAGTRHASITATWPHRTIRATRGG
jgi:hypothetical protein